MLTKIKGFLTPVFDDEEKTRIANLLSVTLLIFFAIALVRTVFALGASREYRLAALSFNLVWGVWLVGLFLLMRAGRVRLVCLALTASQWLLTAWLTYRYGGVQMSTYSIFTFVILAAGLLLDGRFAVGYAVASVVYGTLLFYLESRGIVVSSGETVESAFNTVTPSFITSAVLVYLYHRGITEALGRAHSNERALEERASELASTAEAARRFSAQLEREMANRERAEEASREVHQLLETIFDHTHIMVAYLDPQFNFLRVNRAYAQADERKPSFFPGKNHFDLYPNPENEAIFRRVVETGEPHFELARPFEYAEHPERGASHWDWSLVPIKDAQGTVVGLILTLLNVTERVQAEKLLRIQRDLGVALSETSGLTEALDQLLEAILQVEGIDSGGVYLVDPLSGGLDLAAHKGLRSQFAESVSQYDADSPQARLVMAGKPVYRQYPDVLLVTEEKIRRSENLRALAIIPVKYEGANGHPMVVASLNLASHTRDQIPASTRDALEGIAAQVGGVVARVRAEEALRESEKRYRTLVENAAEGVFIIQDDVVRFANPRGLEIFDRPEDEVVGHLGLDLVHLEDRRKLREIHSRRISGAPAQREYEYRILDKTGSVRWLRANTATVEWAGRRAALMLVTDATERVRTEEQLKEALAEKETLLKEIYHRTKNNLQLVVSLLGLQSDYVKDEQDAEMFRESQNRVKSMAAINEKLYRSADLKRFDFAEYAHSLASHLFRSYDASGVEAIIAVEDIFLDIEQAIPCGLIINELVSNALKYAFPSGDGNRKIRLEFRSEGDQYILVVGDNGIGFPGNLDFRNTASLGLQLVVALTAQLDGHIELDRSSGTTFKITFARKL